MFGQANSSVCRKSDKLLSNIIIFFLIEAKRNVGDFCHSGSWLQAGVAKSTTQMLFNHCFETPFSLTVIFFSKH